MNDIYLDAKSILYGLLLVLAIELTVNSYRSEEATLNQKGMPEIWRAQGDIEASKIRVCIRQKARKNGVVHLEECLP